MPGRFDIGRHDLGVLLEGQPAYRVEQVWAGFNAGREPDEMTDVPKALRSRLAELAPPALSPAAESVADRGTTVKWLWRLGDGAGVETVLMHYRSRSTVCVSTQAGCAMACSFCATGQAGFTRHLSAGEIVEQVVRARRASPDRPVTNVVFMGMGEPLANYEPVWAAVERLHSGIGFSARHLTVSTVGIVPGIRRLATEDLRVNLAVSLHAANDALRDELVPVNRRWPLAVLMEACAEYVEATRRRLSFEWALIAGVNDRIGDARELADLARPLRAHVNLIPLNPTPGYRVDATGAAPAREFAEVLQGLGVNATLRQNRGTTIDAACGQLAAAATITPGRRRALPQ